MTNTTQRQNFLDGMSHVASTVNVVTTNGPGGLNGITVSAMSSVSADSPQPTLLICVHHLSPAAAAIIQNKVFCVNVLRDNQSLISDTFAGRLKTRSQNKFDCVPWIHAPSSSPKFLNSLVTFDCKLVSDNRIGTHHVFIGAVFETEINRAATNEPLLLNKRTYGSPTRLTPTQHPASIAILTVGCFHTFAPALLPQILARSTDNEIHVSVESHHAITAQLRNHQLNAGIIYDLSPNPELSYTPLIAEHPYILLAPDHPLASDHPLSLRALADHPLILLDTPPTRDYVLSLFHHRNLTPTVHIASPSFETVRGLVAHNLGYTILLTQPHAHVSYDGKPLQHQDIADPLTPPHICIAQNNAAHDTIAPFLELCRNTLATS